MSIKFVNTPSLEGMDAQITPVVGENPLCRIPSVRALYTAVSRQELMDHKPGTVQGFVLAFEEGLKNIVFANLDCRHDHFKLVNTVAEAVRTAVEMHSQNIFVPVGTDFTDEEVSLICQGLMIGAYRFDLYKTEKSPKVRFTVYSERDYSAAVQNGKMLGECTNLAGLAEPRPGVYPGQRATVTIKSLNPARMKVKLILIDSFDQPGAPREMSYFVQGDHIDRWEYSPAACARKIVTDFSAVRAQ